MGTVVIGLFVVVAGLAAMNGVVRFLPAPGWLNATVVIMAFCASVCALASTLATTNVLLAGGLAAFMGGLVHAVSAATGIPFGRGEFTAAAGPAIVGLIPWWLPLMWAVITLAARGTARLFLHCFQAHPFHGYRVIAFAAVLATLSFVGIQIFAMRAGLYSATDLTFVMSSASGLVLQMIIQVVVTPLLLDKFPGQRSPNYRPLVVWCVLNGALVMGGGMASPGR